MDWFGKADPYLEVFRLPDPSNPRAKTIAPVLIYKTEEIKGTYSPVFKPFQLSVAKLCNGDHNRPFLIRAWDWNGNTKHDYIGEEFMTLAELLESKHPSKTMKFYKLDSKKMHTYDRKGNRAKKNDKARGEIHFSEVKLFNQPTFLDFLAGGLKIHLNVAIDFTGSNKHPSDPSSLHFRFGPRANQYVTAIQSIGEILGRYDPTQQFSAWGFGAKIIATQQVSHCFPLTMNPHQPTVTGVPGILGAYNNVFNHNQILLSGPTHFSEVIRMAMGRAQQTPFTNQEQHYDILLIITDGIINDMPQTIDAIVHASKLPMSIIIVGVGQTDFGPMNVLDADETPLESKGVRMARDIVQFVPFQKFMNAPPSMLAQEVLQEIPEQVTQFAKMYNVPALPPRTAQEVQMAYNGPPVAAAPPPMQQAPPQAQPQPQQGGWFQHPPQGHPQMQRPPMHRPGSYGAPQPLSRPGSYGAPPQQHHPPPMHYQQSFVRPPMYHQQSFARPPMQPQQSFYGAPPQQAPQYSQPPIPQAPSGTEI
jgi:hypothetical protein